MSNSKTTWLWLTLLILSPSAWSQQYFVKSYNIENGLSTQSVGDACQDQDGIMWFATNDGISSYDGFRFKNYNSENGLPPQHFRRIKCDNTGILWCLPLGLADTIVYRYHQAWKKLPPASDNTTVENTSFDLIRNDTGFVVCVGNYAGVDVFDDNKWQHLDVGYSARQNEVFDVLADNDKFLLLTRTGIIGIARSKGKWKIYDTLHIADKPVLAFHYENRGLASEKLWLLSYNELCYINQGHKTIVSDRINMPDPIFPDCSFLTCDKAGNVYFGNNLVKFYIHKNEKIPHPLWVRNGFSSNSASSVFIDREQNIWFCDTRGVDKINNLILSNYFESNGLLENEVSAIYELKDGRIVIGHNMGITILDHGVFKKFPIADASSIQARVMDIVEDAAGNIWIAASNLGVARINSNYQFKWYHFNKWIKSQTLFADSEGTIWTGTSSKLFYFQKEKWIPFPGNNKIKGPIRKIFPTSDNEMACPGLYHFYLIRNGDVQQLPLDKSVSSESFFSYYETREGKRVIGSNSGLCLLENGKITKYVQNGFTINSPVYFILEDQNGFLWIGSNNGIYIWDNKSKPEPFTLQRGLAGRETNRAAGLVDSKGNVWIGMDKGLSCFGNGFTDLKNSPPVLKLISVEDNKGVNHSLFDKCLIGANDNTLFFHFRGISFVNEDMISYRYKLDGVDNDWQYIKQSELEKVKYQALQPGTYTFLVQTRNGNGPWSDIVKSGTIKVEMPFYNSFWFHILVIALLCIIAYGIIKIILQRRYSKRLENEITERRRSEKITDQTLKSLHASEIKYREFIEFAVDGFLMGNKEGVITGANSYMQNLTGRSKDMLVGKHVSELFNEDILAKTPLRFDLLETGEIVVSHRNILRPDGVLVPVEMHTKMMPDGSYQSIYHDITQRKEADEKLKRSRELYKLIAEKMTDVVWLMDLNGKSTFVSPSIEQFTGYTIEEYLNQTIEMRFVPESFMRVKQLFTNELPRLLSDPASLIGYSNTQQMEYRCKDGSTKWGELLMTPYFDDDGHWIGIHGVTRDITERKTAEEALKQKILELARINNLMIGRELKMIDLKKEINELLKVNNLPAKYIIHD